MVTPHLIAKVGHISVASPHFMAVLSCAAFRFLPMTDSAGAIWILIRFLLGAVMCGAYTVVESWLSDQADSRHHMVVFLRVYTVVVLECYGAWARVFLNLTYGEAAKVFALISIHDRMCAIIPGQS